MKKIINKSILLGIGLTTGFSLLVGNAFASYIVSAAESKGVRITLISPTVSYVLYNSGSPDTEYPLDYSAGVFTPSSSGTASDYLDMPVNYNETLKIREKYTIGTHTTNTDIATFTPSTEGTYDFTSYTSSSDTFNVTLKKKVVYMYTASPVKIYNDVYIYAYYNNGVSNVQEAAWPGTQITGANKTTVATNRYLYKALINASSTHVIFSTPTGDTTGGFCTQTSDLEYPVSSHYMRPTYTLVTYRESGDTPLYNGQGSWSEYPESFTTTNQTAATSNVYICGSMTNGFALDNNYSCTYIGTRQENAETHYVHTITVSLTSGDTFKARNSNPDRWAGYYDGTDGIGSNSANFSSSDGNQGSDILVNTTGVYKFYICTKGNGDVYILKVVKL